MLKKIFKKITSQSNIPHDTSDPIVFYIQKKISKIDKNILLSKPISEILFVVIDTETTGLDLKNDKIINIAGVKVKNFKIIDIYNAFTDSGGIIPKESIKFHGIKDEHLKDKPKIEEIFPDFINFINNSVIVGHHIRFDIQMLNRELKKFFRVTFPNFLIDTGILYNFISNTEEKVSLDYLLEQYNVKCEGRHTALGDAFATAEVFLKMLGELKKKFVTLNDFYQNNLLLE